MSKINTILNQVLSKRSAVELRLEMNMKDFMENEASFIADLAGVLKISPEDIIKIKVLRGCIRYIFDIPEDKARELEEEFKKNQFSPEYKAFLEKYNANPRNARFNVKPELPYMKRFSEISEELDKDGKILAWLHLSDVHFQDESGAAKWNQDAIKESLIESLPNLLGEWTVSPDLVFFTGDLSFSAKQEQYKIAEDFLSEIWTVLQKKVRIYVVPGNHDVSWTEINDLDQELRDNLNSPYEVIDYLTSDSYQEMRVRDFKKFQNFQDFQERLFNKFGTPKIKEDYFYIDKFDHFDIRVGVAGLNSAWRSTRKDKNQMLFDLDLGNLLIGEPQMKKSIDALKNDHLRFAILHHPPQSKWFKDFDISKQALHFPDFDFVLRGHEHESVSQSNHDLNTEKGYIHIASGTLYDSSEFRGKMGYPIRFNAVRLNLTTGKGIMFYWRYFTENYKWNRDVITNDGFKIFDIPSRVMDRLRNPPPGSDLNSNIASAGSRI